MIGLLKQGHQSGANDPDIASSLIKSFVLTLGRRHGRRAAPMPRGGGIATHQLEQLLNWVEKNLRRTLNVEALAPSVSLSIDQFLSEFKQRVGITHWDSVMDQGLQVA